MGKAHGWYCRYSKTDEPDYLGRWARQLFINGLLVGWVSRIDIKGVKFSARTYFPVSGNDYPFAQQLFETFEEAKDFIDQHWKEFTKKI